MLVNGAPAGLSKDSRTPAEFDVTELVRHGGPNDLVAVVLRWSDASFVEDQDQWWHAGLSRDVFLYATDARPIGDVFARADVDGALVVDAGAASQARLIDPRGRIVFDGELEPRAACALPAALVRGAPSPVHARPVG